jgi:dipeptidyl aminopeptidase/acylaminoacyl peptidase
MAGDPQDLETLLRVPHIEAEFRPDFSPDGKQVAFSYNPSGAWEIFVLSLDDPMNLHPITSGPGAKFAPRWSPDGGRVMYGRDLDGSEAYDLYLADLESGETINLTPRSPELILPTANWSPDGSLVALVSDQSGRFETKIIPTSGGTAVTTDWRHLKNNDFQDWEAHWSPDGHQLAIVTRAQGQDAETYLVSLDSGEFVPLRDGQGLLHAREPAWSTDGGRIAFSSDREGRYRIGLYDTRSREIIWIAPEDREQTHPHWAPDGNSLVYLRDDGPENEPVIYTLGDRSIRRLSLLPGTYSHPRFTPDGKRVVFLFENESHPPDLWSFDTQRGSHQQLTRSLPKDLEDAAFVAPEYTRYIGMDGASVPALVYRPPGSADPGPAVVYVHGGPSWLSRRCWSPVVAHMVDRDWLVLAPNYRGSTGYGREWQWANQFDLGGGDTQDVVAGADYLAEEELADPARIAITGTSFGGYLTMTSMTKYPDRWAAGSAVVPFLNWFTEYENEREDLRHWDRENMGVPEADKALFRERSPFFALDRLRAPVQLIAGENDPRCPASESVEAAKALQEEGIGHELVLLRDQGHGALLTDSLVKTEKRRMAFLARVLEG